MAVYFKTGNPAALLKAFNQRIAQEDPKDKITTWERVESNGVSYYTHKAPAWTRQAWFKPVIEEEALRFNIIKPENKAVTVVAYSYYHGHLTETFLTHFDNMFTEAVSSAQVRFGDLVADPK